MSQPVRQMRQNWSTEFSACGCTPYTCLCTNCAAADVHDHVEPGSWCSALFGYIVCAAAGCTICFVRSPHAGRARRLCRTRSATLRACARERTDAQARSSMKLMFAADSRHAARSHSLQPPQVVPCKVEDREKLANKYKVYDESGGCCEFLLCVCALQSST